MSGGSKPREALDVEVLLGQTLSLGGLGVRDVRLRGAVTASLASEPHVETACIIAATELDLLLPGGRTTRLMLLGAVLHS